MKRWLVIAGLLAMGALIFWRRRGLSPVARSASEEDVLLEKRCAAFIGVAGNERADLAPLKTLEAILRSKNDNDRRLDRDFNRLTEIQKCLFREKYAQIPPELRNEQGTLVYLLGKNLRSKKDWDFMRVVADEPPCLSLSNCSKIGSRGDGVGDDVTLAYPALVALKQAEKTMKASQSHSSRSFKEALSVIAGARNSPSPIVKRMALSLWRQR